MGTRSVNALIYSSLVLLLLVGFQNCAVPSEEGADAASLKKAQNDAEAPFAIDLTVNRFAYMSCVKGPKDSQRQQLQTPSFFTFKVAAAEDSGGNAGLRLTDEFTAFAEKNLPKRADPATGVAKVPRDEVKGLFASSLRNAGLQLQMAIRPLELPAINIQTSDDEYFATTIMPLLTSDHVAEQITDMKSGQRLNYVDGGKGIDGRDLEGSIGFFDSQEFQNKIRNDLSNKRKAMVTLTFSAPASADENSSGNGGEAQFVARSPYSYSDTDSKNTAYGLGFQPFFAQADSRYIDNPQHVLRELREFDLSIDETERTNKAEWICDSSLRYMIFSPGDAEDTSLPVNCPKIPDPLGTTDPAVKAEMQMLRSVLPSEHWYINIPGKCIVPKEGRGDCYPKDIPVQYETSKECGPGTTRDCAHFLSICYRPNNN